MKQDEDAVASVVAVMLILAILSTCIAVYSATYVPGLKQQSEILHSEEVQYSFLRFTSDVNNGYSLGKPVQFTEPVTLGGGDILLSPVRSSGTIELSETTFAELDIDGVIIPINTTNVTYRPSYSLWESQGYRYENGVVWVVKGTKETPAEMSLYTSQQGKNQENQTLENRLRSMDKSFTLSGSNATMQIISMSAGNKSFVSGSGNANLRLNATEQETRYSLPAGSTVILRKYPSGNVVKSFTVVSDTEFVLRTLTMEVSVE